MKKVVAFVFAFLIVISATTTEAVGLTETSRSGFDVSFELAEEGVFGVYYNTNSTKKIKLIVKKDEDQYIYNINNGDEMEYFPFQLGEGRYSISLYENTSGTRYKKLHSTTYTVSLENDNDVYLQSIQEINWQEDNEAIVLAEELISQAEANQETELTDQEKIDILYDYVVNNIDYDYDKIRNLEYNYLPDIDRTLTTGSGICYDYSSLLASMLRSQGIPTKLVKGYTVNTSVYHAWNEIYLESEDRWIVVDTTFDAYYASYGYAYDMEKPVEDYTKNKEY